MGLGRARLITQASGHPVLHQLYSQGNRQKLAGMRIGTRGDNDRGGTSNNHSSQRRAKPYLDNFIKSVPGVNIMHNDNIRIACNFPV